MQTKLHTDHLTELLALELHGTHFFSAKSATKKKLILDLAAHKLVLINEANQVMVLPEANQLLKCIEVHMNNLLNQEPAAENHG